MFKLKPYLLVVILLSCGNKDSKLGKGKFFEQEITKSDTISANLDEAESIMEGYKEFKSKSSKAKLGIKEFKKYLEVIIKLKNEEFKGKIQLDPNKEVEMIEGLNGDGIGALKYYNNDFHGCFVEIKFDMEEKKVILFSVGDCFGPLSELNNEYFIATK